MRKEILKSKMMMIALASILFVSCGGGGGGGGGGSSNLPINPGTPSVPKPSTPSNPEDNYPKMTNPLDGQKGNISALKTSLYNAQVASNVTIPKDTREEDGKVAGVLTGTGVLEGEGVKVAVLDADFQDAVRSSVEDKDGKTVDKHGNPLVPRRTRTLTNLYPGIEILPRINSEIADASSISNTKIEHGEEVLEVIKDMETVSSPPENKIGLIVGSFGQDYHDNKTNKNVYGAVLPNKETYDAALAKFGNQNIKIFNQSFGSGKAYDDPEYARYKGEGYSTMPLSFNKAVGSTNNPERQIPYFRDIVENKGGLFIWSAGNDKDKNSTLDAGLPYFDNRLEPGWISVVGVEELQNGKYNIMGTGEHALSSAGPEAAYWAISAYNGGATNSAGFYGVGSSYAAPRVTMAAALVYEKYPWMTNDQIRQTLFTTTDKMELDKNPDDENTTEVEARNVTRYPDSKYGWGMLNTERALKGPGAFMKYSKYGYDSSTFKADVPAMTTSYFDNNIYGDGGLQKRGFGTLHLTGNNSFSGGSVVRQGILEIHQVHASPITVEAGGKLVLNPKAIVGYDIDAFKLIENIDPQKITDSGIKIRNYGTVAFKGTTAIIGGDYVGYSGSTTEVNFLSNVKVLGDIKYEPNTTVKILSNGYVTTQGSSNTIMEGKSFEGNIANVETNGMRTANVEVKDGKVVATLSRQNPSEYLGENAEASSKNVAENVEKVFEDLDQKVMSGTATKEEVLMGATVQSMSTMGFTSATEMMSGEIYASAQALTFSQAQNVNRDLSNRLSGLDNFKNSNKDSEVWFSVLGSAGKLRRDGYASADTRVTGGQFGADTKFSPTTTLGVALNYSYAKADFNRYAGESKSDMVGVSLYGKQDLPYGFYTAGRLGLSHISSKVERELLTSTGDTVTGKINHHDKMLSAYVELGKKFGWFTPFIGYSQDYLRRGSFDESEASWGIKADKKNYRTSNFLVGARAEYVGNKYKLQAYVTQAINTDKRDLSYEGRFTGSSVKQKFYGVKQAKNTTWIGFGAFREITPVFGVYGNVDFRVEDKKWADSVFSAGLQYRF
ncbi:autotransporter serine protease fusolisin [Fusobacterium nucleatum]|uniref:autotransporter serine protease fusolisin n=1 Tax=Fusobacterium nucleatum TaxID=851 RepID=UPI001EF0168B|nr:autotransporter serine protease fusolisin [Fusobacterium nucleatum]MCG6845701.1 autotransporter serine protease fusolisin [Fusobacterium nucleatum]